MFCDVFTMNNLHFLGVCEPWSFILVRPALCCCWPPHVTSTHHRQNYLHIVTAQGDRSDTVLRDFLTLSRWILVTTYDISHTIIFILSMRLVLREVRQFACGHRAGKQLAWTGAQVHLIWFWGPTLKAAVNQTPSVNVIDFQFRKSRLFHSVLYSLARLIFSSNQGI